MTATRPLDAVVIGGGPAGLAAAINIARACRTVALVDCDQPGRSDYAQINHNYLGFPQGVAATELRDRGREQAARFGVRFVEAEAAAIRRLPEGFVVEAPDAEPQIGRAVVLATGVADNWPRFPGYEGFVGRSVHWCIICDGYEMQGQRVVVVGNNDEAAETAVQLTRFTPTVSMLANDGSLGLSPDAADRLARRGIPLIVDRIVGATAREPGMLATLQLERGGEMELDHLFSEQGALPRVALARSLGVALDEHGYIRTDHEQRTSEPGVYAAGDVTRLFAHQVATAVHEGATASAALVYDLFVADES